MLLKLLKVERMKLKRSPIWLAFLIMPVIPALLGTLNYRANIEILKSEWYSLWTQHTLFTCYFFLPIMLGVYCACLMRLEHNHHNWNKLLTMPVSRPMIFTAKQITASFMVLLSELWIGALFILSGRLTGLTDPPIKEILMWCLFGALGGMVTVSIQLVLSLFIKSFALPVGIAFAGGLSGLIFLVKKLGNIWPYSLMAYGMNANSPQQMTKSGFGLFAAVCLVYLVIFTVTGATVLSKKDV